MGAAISGDYYEVLGVPRDADTKTIKNAFRQLARRQLSSRQRQLYEQLRAEDAGIRSTAGGSREPDAPRSGRRITADGAGRHAAGRGLVIFASVLLLVTGAVNLAGGVAAITGSHIFITNAQYLSGGLHAWGWIMTILSAVQLLAAAGVWAGNQLADGWPSPWSGSARSARCSSFPPTRSGPC